MWLARPQEPDTDCDLCKRGAGDGVGPFWQGPKRLTGLPGFGRKQMGRLHVCRECMFVVVNGEGSPFQGLIPAGEAALETARQADAHVTRLRDHITELREAKPASPEEVAEVAVRAAIAELDSRGVFAPPEPPAEKPKPPARKQAAAKQGG